MSLFDRGETMKQAFIIAVGLLSACDRAGPVENVEMASAPTSAWRYRTYDDPMREERTWIANLTSTNQADLKFPYSGDTTATLEMAQGQGEDPENRQVILILSDGQLDCSRLCYLSLKFDDGEVFESTGTESDCGESKCVNVRVDADDEAFGTPESIGFHKRLAESKKLIVEVPIYRYGRHQFTFDSVGLVWPQPGAPVTGKGSRVRNNPST